MGSAIAAVDHDAPEAPAGTADVARLRTDPIAWDAFVASTPNGSFPQLSGWADANAGRAWRSTRLVVTTPGGPVGAQVLMHRMRPGPVRPRGMRGGGALTSSSHSQRTWASAVPPSTS